MATTRKVIIIGSGPAAYTAAIFSASHNPPEYNGVKLFDGDGQKLTDEAEEEIEALLGEAPRNADEGRIDNLDVVHGSYVDHVIERFGTEMITEDVTAVDFARRPFTVSAGGESWEALTVIVATGAAAKLLGLENESKLMGRGVSTCATCDGFFFKDQNIMVVGGGDSAIEEALYLARLGRKVDVVHRRDTLRASKIMQERALKNPKIAFIWDSAVEDIRDAEIGRVTTVALRNLKTDARSEQAVDGLFIAIGHQPNTEIFRGQLELLPNDYVKVEPGTTQTSVPGVFAAGDVQDFTYRQAVTAAGSGCMAALEAERFLEATHS